jgi:L-cysteine/cystine lyase
MVAPFMPDDEKITAVREALPATGAGIYLNTGSAGPLPAESVRAMREIEDWELRVGRASPDEWDAVFERIDEARGVLGALLHAAPDAIALTSSTMDGLHLALAAPRWERGDRVVTTNLEYPGVVGALLGLGERFGIEVDVVDVGGDHETVLARFDRAISGHTKLVIVSHVTYATGEVLPATEIGELARRNGAWYVVDGAQAAGAIPTQVEEIGADFYAVPAQKWLLGPEGIGALWAGPRAVAEAAQSGRGGFQFDDVAAGGDPRPREGARRFDASTLHHPSIVGFARGVGWLEMYVGLEWAYERAQRLARATADRLRELDGVRLVTPTDHVGTIFSFRVEGWTADQVRIQLMRRVYAITRTIPEIDAVRISVGFFNTEEELERFVDAVKLLAGHTPQTLPERPALVVLPGTVGSE